jgi:hypothetical protein
VVEIVCLLVTGEVPCLLKLMLLLPKENVALSLVTLLDDYAHGHSIPQLYIQLDIIQ